MNSSKELSTNQLYNIVILRCGSIENFASSMGLTRQGAYNKIKNLKKWTVSDIEKARLILGIYNSTEFARLFFE